LLYELTPPRYFAGVTPLRSFTAAIVPGTPWSDIDMNRGDTAIGANPAAFGQCLKKFCQLILADAADLNIDGLASYMI
jgi:hypothetical protein